MRTVESSREWEEANPGRRRLSVPRSRGVVSDVVFFERSLPTYPHSRDFDLGRLAAIRESAAVRVSWPVLFIKAFGLVSREFPILRQVLLKFPFPHYYCHPHSVGYLAVKREDKGEEWLFFAPFRKPEEQSLEAMQHRLECFRTEPVESAFRTQYRSAFLPVWLRRLIVWSIIHWQGDRRAKRFGTFGVTTISSRGAIIQNPPGINTSTLTYGPIGADGRCQVTIAYDHRLMDGWFVAEVLERLETVLNGPIADELEAVRP